MTTKPNKSVIMLRALLEGQPVKIKFGGKIHEIYLGENSKGKTVTGILGEKNGEEILLVVDLSIGEFIDAANEMSDDDTFIMSANAVLREGV